MTTEAQVDAAALALSRRLDVAMFYLELHEDHPNMNRLRLDARRIRERWGVDVSRLLPQP